LITRSIDYDGANYPLQTDIQQADLSNIIGELEGVKQEFGNKKQASERALVFLVNPFYADRPLDEMKDGLLQLLGHELYNELGVRNASDKDALVQYLKTNV
jgi:hypothetical protein